MNVTHAKPANRQEQGHQTRDLGLKHPCECGSGKKFKHCCYDTAAKGWGWVRLYQEGYGLVAYRLDPATLPGAVPTMAGAALVPIYPTYRQGLVAAAGMPAAKPTWLVRMPTEELRLHIRQQFPPGSHVVLHEPGAIAPDGETALHEIIVARPLEAPRDQ